MKYFVKVELVLNVERFLPDFIREKWIVKTERIFPNQTNLLSLFLFNKATYKHIVEKVSKWALLLFRCQGCIIQLPLSILDPGLGIRR